jgi:hypothetical protein
LQLGGQTIAARAILANFIRDFAAPIGLNGQITFRLSGNLAGCGQPSATTQWGVTETADIVRFAVYSAARLTGFYHGSVLRCGLLAERKSGVMTILPVNPRRKINNAYICCVLWRNE